MKRILRATLSLCLVGSFEPLLTAADVVIDQKNREFSRSEVTLKPGDKLVFHNSDEVTHNVFSATPGMEFDIRRQAPGASSSIPFEREGVAEVRCSIHPKMKILVTIKE